MNLKFYKDFFQNIQKWINSSEGFELKTLKLIKRTFPVGNILVYI